MDIQALFGTVSHLHGLQYSRYRDGHPYLLSYTFYMSSWRLLTNGLADVSVTPLRLTYDDGPQNTEDV